MVKRRILAELPFRCVSLLVKLTWGDDTLWDIVFDSPRSASIDLTSATEGPLIERLRPYVEAAQYYRTFDYYCNSPEQVGRPSVNVKLITHAPPRLKKMMLTDLAQNMHDYSHWSTEICWAVPKLIDEFASACPEDFARGVNNSQYLTKADPELIASLPDSIRPLIHFKRSGNYNIPDEINELVKFGLVPTKKNRKVIQDLWVHFNELYQADRAEDGQPPAKRARKSTA